MNLPAMEAEIRRATLAMIPVAPNARLRRQLSIARDSLGEPLAPIHLESPASVWFLRLRHDAGNWQASGIHPRDRADFLLVLRGTPRFAVAWRRRAYFRRTAWAGTALPFTPRNGDLLRANNQEYRVVALQYQDVDQVGYYLLTGELA